MSQILTDLNSAIDIFTAKKGSHIVLRSHQVKTLEYLLRGENSINQLPCGAGKTLPAICFPDIQDILRDNFSYDISSQTRVLLIVPLGKN